MPKYCKIIVHYLDGTVVEFYGGLHVDERLLRIYPYNENKMIAIPLNNLQWYITE